MNKKEIIEFIKEHNFIYLSTVNHSGFPECRALVNLLNINIAPHLSDFFQKNGKLYFMTNTSSEKIKHIAVNSLSSLYCIDEKHFNGLLLLGKTYEIKDNILKKQIWHDDWNFYYNGGLEGGDFSIIEFVPEKCKSYSNLSVKEENINW